MLVQFPSQVFFNHLYYEGVTLGWGPLYGNASLCGMLPASMEMGSYNVCCPVLSSNQQGWPLVHTQQAFYNHPLPTVLQCLSCLSFLCNLTLLEKALPTHSMAVKKWTPSASYNLHQEASPTFLPLDS